MSNEMTAVETFGAIPWRIEPYCTNLICDANGTHIADVRGWGHLTGTGAGGLGLPSKEAVVLQAAVAHRLVECVNGYAELQQELAEARNDIVCLSEAKDGWMARIYSAEYARDRAEEMLQRTSAGTEELLGLG